MNKIKTTVNYNSDTLYSEDLKGLKLYFRKLSYRDIMKKIEKYCKSVPENILEIGAGSGYFLKFIHDKYKDCRTIAIEYDERLHSTIHNNSSSTKILKENAEDFNLGQKFDLIVSTHVIEHLYKPGSMIDAIKSHLTVDGTVIITTPNRNCVAYKIYGSDWNGIRDDHVSLMDLCELRLLLEERGFKIIYEATTFFSGVKFMRKLPFRIINDTLLVIFGSIRWSYGEASIVVAQLK